MKYLGEEVGADSLDATLEPSSKTNTIYPNIQSHNYEGLRQMEIQSKFKELLQKMEAVREMSSLSNEIQEILSGEQDEISTNTPEEVQAYLDVLDVKERFTFLNTLIVSLDREVTLLASEILDGSADDDIDDEPEQPDEENEDEENDDEEEAPESDGDADLEALLNDLEIDEDEKKESRRFSIRRVIESKAEANQRKLVESQKLTEKTTSKHIKKCIAEVGGIKDSKKVASAIQDYYDDNSVGGSFSKFKKAVIGGIKDKKESIAKNKRALDEAKGCKLIKTLKDKDKKAQVKVYKDSKTGEYVAEIHQDGKHQEKADYFTDDKEDALKSAEAMLKKVKAIKESTEVELDESDTTKTDTQTELVENDPSVRLYKVVAKLPDGSTRDDDQYVGELSGQTMSQDDAYDAIYDLEMKRPEEMGDVVYSIERIYTESREQDTPLEESTSNKHVKQCLSSLDKSKMTRKEMDAIIQDYYKDNDIGGTLSKFRKSVISALKNEK